MGYDLSIQKASKQFKVSKPALLYAIRKGRIPVQIVTTPEIRVMSKDVKAYVATIPEWRRASGRKGGLRKAANRRARARSPQSASQAS